MNNHHEPSFLIMRLQKRVTPSYGLRILLVAIVIVIVWALNYLTFSGPR